MKTFIGFIVLAVVTLATGQQTFEEYLHELQYESQSLHRQFEGTFDNSRYSMSDYVNRMNINAMEVVLGGVESASSIRAAITDYVNSLERNAQCIALVLSEFNNRYDAHGFEMRACSLFTQQTINILTDRVHDAISSGSVFSRNAQDAVINAITQWNPIMRVDELSYIVRSNLERYENEFTASQNELQAALTAVSESVATLPVYIKSCLDPILESLEHYSQALELQAWGCAAA